MKFNIINPKIITLLCLLIILTALISPAFAQEDFPVVATIPVGQCPTDVVFAPDGKTAYVVNFGSDSVSVIDVEANVVIATVPVGDGPFNPGITPDGTKLFVPNLLSKDISVIDTVSNALIATIPTSLGFTRTYPSNVVFSPDGDLAYIVNAAGGCDFISIIQVSSLNIVGSIDIPRTSVSNAMAIAPDGMTAYLTNGDANCVSVIDLTSNQLVAAIPVGLTPIHLALTPLGEKLYVANSRSGDVSVIDTATNTVIGTITVGGNPFRLLISSRGDSIYVVVAGLNKVVVIDPEIDVITGSIAIPLLTTYDPQDEIVMTQDGRFIFITHYQSDFVSVIDTYPLSPTFNTIIASVPVGLGPSDLAISPDGELLYVVNYLSCDVTVIALVIPAEIDIHPDTLNLKSKGKWITAYIELPEGYDVSTINVSTAMLNDQVQAETHPTEIGDYDDDSIDDLMVKFDRSAVQEILEVGDEVEITITGELAGGATFEGTDTIRVVDKGKGK